MYILLFILICLIEMRNTKELKIEHLDGFTVKSCGLNSFKSVAKYNHCFKWHKTIEENKMSMSGIHGGRNAEYGEFPYTVLILIVENLVTQTCTGAIINERWIITAAHCLDGSLEKYRIYTGLTDYPSNLDKYIAAERFIIHERYDKKSKWGKKFDIGLIKLDRKIDESDTVNGVCLSGGEFHILHSEPELATFSGWGARDDDTVNTVRLKTSAIKINVPYNSNYENIITRDVSLGILCNGDSGGPLVQYINSRAVLIGVLSTAEPSLGKKCGPINRMDFVSIPFHRTWINEKILNN